MEDVLIAARRTDCLRVVVWNAAMGVHRKLAALASLDPDIAIVPECGEPERVFRSGSVPAGVTMAWIGRLSNKGLGVFGFHDHRVALLDEYDPRLQWVAPIEVSGSAKFNLLAVWAYNHRATEFHPIEPKTAQPQQALDVYADLLRAGPVLVAGDFNNNVVWDRAGRETNWSRTVARYRAAGLVSAYHAYSGEAQGTESIPTLYWRSRRPGGPTYHIDYCFIPEAWVPSLRTVAAGDFPTWVGGGRSDHVPLVVDLAREAFGA